MDKATVSKPYLGCSVAELCQNFSSVVRNDAHGVGGKGEFFQTGQHSNVLYFIQLQKMMFNR